MGTCSNVWSANIHITDEPQYVMYSFEGRRTTHLIISFHHTASTLHYTTVTTVTNKGDNELYLQRTTN
jgi:hypothetical protein